ncbi:hypothetical protein MRB53_034181 [Persea americana]|uniref:Uncharacterized protein n=1 Tax=Persea americana TaxID=3435 RepID=A0ACC2KWX3_PERAE|nr:hypothetical protein MRB53_034181 [Persea americana]
MRSIKHLPKAVYSSLRSSVIFFDITRVVEELVSNSVDAGATKVHVFVNVRACYIKVEDDGYGISRDGLVLLGERYATSKLCCLAEMDVGVESLGFRGEALGSLSDVCLLEVITKARGKPNGYRKVIKGSRCLFLGIDDYRQDVGTTVIVRDLFYNQPVRRKCMQTSPKKVLHSVKKCVLRIALVCPQVSFKVIDIEGEDELFCTLPSVSPLPLVASSFGNGVSSSLRELKFYEGAFKISGYLSGPPDTFSTKVFQFIYVNSRAVSKGPINKLLDSLAAKFECLMTSWRDESESQTAKRQRKQAYLAYMLNICCPHSTYDLTFEPSKTLVEFKDWSPVLSFLEKAIRHFWQESAPPFYKGEFDGHEEDLQGKGKLWKGSNTNVLPLKDPFTLDLSEASGIAKKKSKMQHNQSSAYISPSTGLLEMSSADIDFLSDQHHQSSSRESRTNVIDQEGWHKDHFLRERPVLKQTTEDDGRDAILHLRRNRAFDIDANLSEGSAGVTAICNHFDCKTDAGRVSSLSHGEGALETAIFSNSASMGGILDESTVFSNHRGSTIQFDDVRTERKSLASVDSIDEISISTPSKVKQAAFQLSPGIIRKYITDNLVQSTFHIPSPSYNNRGSTLRENEYRRNCGQDHVSKVRPRRSHSAPPFYKGRNKFSFFYGCSTTKKVTEPDLQSFHRAPNVPVTHFELNELSEVTVTKWRSGDPLPTDGGKSRNLPEQENEILDISSGILHLAGSSLVPDSINKDCLESAKVLPQVDRKFIPVMAGGILAIIDQHAADERIRLEELRRKVLSGEEKTIAYLDSEQELVLPEIGLQLLQNYTEQILDWGWICNIHTRSSGSFTKNMNLLHKQSFTVTLVAVPCILGINLSDKDLLEFLEQLAETDGTSTMPPAVLRVLNFKACRGAIMFGDVLLPSECSLIVEELKATSLCFQCAHGRPTTVPIVNMEALQKQLANLRLQNGGSPEQWHGLRHHKPSLERAKLRLSRFVCN